MNKNLKYTIIVVVVAFVIYIAYRFFKKPAEVKDTVKQPVQTASSGNEKAVMQGGGDNYQARGPILVDIKSGGANVSNLTNGLAPDPATIAVPISTPTSTATTLTGGSPTIKTDPLIGPVLLHPTTDQPTVSDLSNGLAADVPTTTTINTDVAPVTA